MAEVAELTIIVDNRKCLSPMETAWGFSALIKTTDGIEALFDTGPAPDVLKHNLEVLNISLNGLRYIVISHNHWDHIGGLEAIIKDDLRVILPEAVDENAAKVIKEVGAELLVNSSERPLDLGGVFVIPPVVSQRTYRGIKEQAMVLPDFPEHGEDTLLVGCSHPGVDELLYNAIQYGFKPTWVIGGSHLKALDDVATSTLNRLIELGVKHLSLTHCTSDEVIAHLKEMGVYKDFFAGCSVRVRGE